MSYKVQLEVFEGPLDLLLYLIKKEELDIQHISIARITEQYLEYIRVMQMLNLDVAGEFLLMAATLMHIKSRMLLPQEELLEELEEDSEAELVKQLMEYQRFKEAAEKMEALGVEQEEIFSRGQDAALELDEKEGYLLEANLFDLISAFTQVLEAVGAEGTFGEIIEDETTVKEKILYILDLLRGKDALDFTGIFREQKTREEMVVTFLALLELMRLREIKVRQTERFSDIRVYKADKQEEPKEHIPNYEKV